MSAPINRRKLNAMSAGGADRGEDVFVNGESSALAKRQGSGAIRKNMPVSWIVRRMANKVLHETVKPKHEKIPGGKRTSASELTDEQVRLMRLLYKNGRVSVTDLSVLLERSYSGVLRILNGENYSHVID